MLWQWWFSEASPTRRTSRISKINTVSSDVGSASQSACWGGHALSNRLVHVWCGLSTLFPEEELGLRFPAPDSVALGGCCDGKRGLSYIRWAWVRRTHQIQRLSAKECIVREYWVKRAILKLILLLFLFLMWLLENSQFPVWLALYFFGQGWTWLIAFGKMSVFTKKVCCEF